MNTFHMNAGVSELADETDSKSVFRKEVRVQVPPPAVKKNYYHQIVVLFIFYNSFSFITLSLL